MNCKLTKTGDLVQVSECKENEVTYGVISIKLKDTYSYLQEAENVLIEFMQQLQPTFAIQHTTGICKDYKHEASKRAVTDYWQDVDGRDWKVRGWTDGGTIAILYIKNIGQVAVAKETCFLDGRLFVQA